MTTFLHGFRQLPPWGPAIIPFKEEMGKRCKSFQKQKQVFVKMLVVKRVLYLHGLKDHSRKKSEGASYKWLSDISSFRRNRAKIIYEMLGEAHLKCSLWKLLTQEQTMFKKFSLIFVTFSKYKNW